MTTEQELAEYRLANDNLGNIVRTERQGRQAKASEIMDCLGSNDNRHVQAEGFIEAQLILHGESPRLGVDVVEIEADEAERKSRLGGGANYLRFVEAHLEGPKAVKALMQKVGRQRIVNAAQSMASFLRGEYKDKSSNYMATYTDREAFQNTVHRLKDEGCKLDPQEGREFDLRYISPKSLLKADPSEVKRLNNFMTDLTGISDEDVEKQIRKTVVQVTRKSEPEFVERSVSLRRAEEDRRGRVHGLNLSEMGLGEFERLRGDRSDMEDTEAGRAFRESCRDFALEIRQLAHLKALTEEIERTDGYEGYRNLGNEHKELRPLVSTTGERFIRQWADQIGDDQLSDLGVTRDLLDRVAGYHPDDSFAYEYDTEDEWIREDDERGTDFHLLHWRAVEDGYNSPLEELSVKASADLKRYLEREYNISHEQGSTSQICNGCCAKFCSRFAYVL